MADPRYFFGFFHIFFFFKIKDSADFFVCNFPTLFCRKFAGRPVADPRYFFGFSHTFFGVKIKVSADRFFVVVGIPTLFGRFTARAVANSRYFIGFLRLKIQRMQNAPPYREKKKQTNRQTEAKSHAIVTTR